MKKNISFSLLVLILSIAITSCRKHKQGTVTYQTIEVNLDADKSYQYNFGSGEKDLSISKQSTSFVVSEIDKSSESNVFKYMAKLNTTSDVVEVTLYEEEEHHGHHGHHGGNGNCQNHHDANGEEHHDADDDRTVYTFKFNIHNVAATSTTKAVEVSIQK